jgi:hypothetical protein
MSQTEHSVSLAPTRQAREALLAVVDNILIDRELFRDPQGDFDPAILPQELHNATRRAGLPRGEVRQVLEHLLREGTLRTRLCKGQFCYTASCSVTPLFSCEECPDTHTHLLAQFEEALAVEPAYFRDPQGDCTLTLSKDELRAAAYRAGCTRAEVIAALELLTGEGELLEEEIEGVTYYTMRCSLVAQAG